MPDKKDETAVWDYESKEKKTPSRSALSAEEKLKILEEFRSRQRKEGPGADIDLAPERGPFLTDSSEAALTQLGRGTGVALDEWDRRSSMEMPVVPGMPRDSDAPRFSPVAGTVRAFRKGVDSIDDVVKRMGYKGKTGPINEALRERRLADDIVRADRKVVGDPDLLDDFPGLKENSKKYKRADEVADADFEKTLQAGEEAIAEKPGLFKDMTDAEMKGSAEFLRAKPFSPNREELTLYYKLLESGKTPQQAQLTLQNRRLMQP